MEFQAITQQILEEIRLVVDGIENSEIEAFCEEILKARRIFLYSMGREGLVIRGFAMRLMHLGMNAAMVGDMTTPPIAEGDLLILSCGPGTSNTLFGLSEVAHKVGGRIAIITAQIEGKLLSQADLRLHIPAQTMAEQENKRSVQPMGSVFEQAEWIVLDCIVALLQNSTGQSAADLRKRHTNLE